MTFGERFLARPERFPDSVGGKPWGEHVVTLDVAGPVCFSGLNDTQLAAVEARYGRVTEDTVQADVPGRPRIRCLRMERAEFIDFDRTGWEYTVDLDPAAERLRVAGYLFAGMIRLAPGLEGAFWTCEDGSDEFPGVIENFYRIFTAYHALEQGGILLHSAGVVHGGQAYVFVGHSGAGKSTLVGNALRQGYDILSDDLNLVLAGEAPAVRRVPFAGTYGRAPAGNESWPLGGIIRLKKGDNTRRRLSLAVATAAIIGSSPFVNRDPYRDEQLADLAEALARRLEPWEAAAAREGFDRNLLEPPPG